MDVSFWLPLGVSLWLSQSGGFLLLCFGLLTLLLLGLRPLVLWYFRINEQRDYQKRQVELEGKIAIELESLNQLMRMPLKKAGAKKTEEKSPLVETDKEAFLAALDKLRSKSKEEEPLV